MTTKTTTHRGSKVYEDTKMTKQEIANTEAAPGRTMLIALYRWLGY